MTTPPFWGRTMTGLPPPAGALPLQAARSVANYRKQESLDSEVIDFPIHDFRIRSYWIPGSYAPELSEKRSSFLRLLKNKGFKEDGVPRIRWYAIGTSTTLESNKSHRNL